MGVTVLSSAISIKILQAKLHPTSHKTALE
jgi:hypothetical protein